MAADIYLNGVYLNYTNDQFLRYSFPVADIVKATWSRVKG
jgi:hypothetical protein